MSAARHCSIGFVISIFMALLMVQTGQAQEIVGHFRERPPLMYLQEGKFSGVLVDIANEAAQRAGLIIQWRQVPFKRSIKLLEAGDDRVLLPRVSRTATRELFIRFSPSVAKRHKTVRFVMLDDSPFRISSYEDLIGLRVGLLRGSNYFSRFNEDPNLSRTELNDYQSMAKLLKRGRIDVFASIDHTVAIQALSDHQVASWRFADYEWTEVIETYFGMAKQSGSANKLFGALEKMMEEGAIRKIYRRHGIDYPGS